MSLVSNTTLTLLRKEDTINNTTFNLHMTIDNPTITTTNNGTIQLTSDNYINNITLKTNVVPSSQTKTMTITENTTTTITPDNNIPYLDSVIVNTNVIPSSQTKTVTITQNGTTTITPDNNINYLDSVIVNTNVPQYKIDKINCYYLNTSHIMNLTTLTQQQISQNTAEENITWTDRFAKIYTETENTYITLKTSWPWIKIFKYSQWEIYTHMAESNTIGLTPNTPNYIFIPQDDQKDLVIRYMDSNFNDIEMFVSQLNTTLFQTDYSGTQLWNENLF